MVRRNPKGRMIRQRRKQKRRSMIELVRHDGEVLENLSPYWQNCHDVVLQAVKDEGAALKYASDRLRNNRTIVFAAVNENPYTLGYVSDKLKEDPDVIRLARERGLHEQHLKSLLYDKNRRAFR